MARRSARVLPIVVLLGSLAVSVPARADYAAGDPRDSNTRMDIRRVTSAVVHGSINGHPAKIVRFRVVFDHAVPWATLHTPDLMWPMDSRSTSSADYRLDIFRHKFPGDPHRMHCWLRDASGAVVLDDDAVVSYSAAGTVARCAFPKGAMTVRGSGVVRWAVQSSYTADAAGHDYRYDNVPGVAPFLFPHL
ncbi:MAG TPA: hypothetical protein VID47_05020 [Actinomycetota bacterium]|jgi:hypothetical protein